MAAIIDGYNVIRVDDVEIPRVFEANALLTGIKDSGERQSFISGAVRDCQGGKGFFYLLPFVSLFLVSRIYEDGAKKYAARNWEKGIPISRFVDSAMRHLAKYMDGLRDEPHLSMAGWNILGALWTAVKVKMGLLPQELNDLPNGANPLSLHEEVSLKTWYDEHGEK